MGERASVISSKDQNERCKQHSTAQHNATQEILIGSPEKCVLIRFVVVVYFVMLSFLYVGMQYMHSNAVCAFDMARKYSHHEINTHAHVYT